MLLLTQLTDDNSLIVHDWEEIRIEPNNIGDNLHLGFYHSMVLDILSKPPCGEVLAFDDFTLRCQCGDEDCATTFTISCNGAITVNERGEKLTAKVDPRYTARIFDKAIYLASQELTFSNGYIQIGKDSKISVCVDTRLTDLMANNGNSDDVCTYGVAIGCNKVCGKTLIIRPSWLEIELPDGSSEWAELDHKTCAAMAKMAVQIINETCDIDW